MTRQVFLRIDGTSDESSQLDTSLFGIADISPVSERISLPLNPNLLGLTVPMVGSTSDAWREIPMAEGNYLARVKLPNGQLFTETISVPHGNDDLRIILGESRDDQADLTSERTKPEYADPVRQRYEREMSARRPALGFDRYEPTRPDMWTPRIVETIVYPSRIRQKLEMSSRGDRSWSDLLFECLGDSDYFPRDIAWEHTTSDSASFTWPINTSIRNGDRPSRRNSAQESDFLNRRYIAVWDNRYSVVACLPHKWQAVNAHTGNYDPIPVGARVTARSQLLGKITRSISLSLTVSDPQIQSILGFLQEGDLSAARIIVSQCIDYLRDKFQNEYAAAAAGYILVMSPAEQQSSSPWEQWIGNLGHYFGNLPDGDILHATLLLQRGRELASSYGGHDYFPESIDDRLRLAVDLTLSSLGKGLPIYRQGLRLLASNLRILLDADLEYEVYDVKTSLERAYAFVTWLSMRVNPREAFTVIDITDVN